MGLYIRDPSVNALADQLAAMTGKTKTQVVREALESRLATISRSQEEIMARIREIQERARAAGFVHDPDFDDKAFMDDLSGGI